MEEPDCYSKGMFKLVPRWHKRFSVLILCWNMLSYLAMYWLFSYLHGLGRLTDWSTSNPRYTTGSKVHRTVIEPKGCERKSFLAWKFPCFWAHVTLTCHQRLNCLSDFYEIRYTVFARVICALFFSVLAAEKSGCVKYADFFFVEVLIWVLF